MKYLPYIIIVVLILFIVFRPARVEHVSGEVYRQIAASQLSEEELDLNGKGAEANA